MGFEGRNGMAGTSVHIHNKVQCLCAVMKPYDILN
jgi:hypothetical protein